MTKPAPHANRKVTPDRCLFRKSNGSQCRSLAASNSELCAAHRVPAFSPAIVPDHQPVELDLAEELGITSRDFKGNEEIYYFLCKLTYLLSANRISSRRAAVLAYITSQALRTSCVLERNSRLLKKRHEKIPKSYGISTVPIAPTK
jgi:hypothetical protein